MLLLAFDLPGPSDVTKPCRPTVSCTADLAAPGSLEIESGATATRSAAGVRQWVFPFLVKQTFAKFAQMQITSNGVTLTSDPRSTIFGDIQLGPKLRFLEQGRFAPSIALTALVGIPASEGRSASGYFTGHVSKDIGPVHFDLNGAAYAYSTAVQGMVSFATSVTFAPPFAAALEVYGFSDASPAAPSDGGVRAVLATTVHQWLVFDVGSDVRFFQTTRAFSMFFGVTFLPFVIWR